MAECQKLWFGIWRHSVGPDLSPVISRWQKSLLAGKGQYIFFCGASALSVLSMEIYVGEQAI